MADSILAQAALLDAAQQRIRGSDPYLRAAQSLESAPYANPSNIGGSIAAGALKGLFGGLLEGYGTRRSDRLLRSELSDPQSLLAQKLAGAAMRSRANLQLTKIPSGNREYPVVFNPETGQVIPLNAGVLAKSGILHGEAAPFNVLDALKTEADIANKQAGTRKTNLESLSEINQHQLQMQDFSKKLGDEDRARIDQFNEDALLREGFSRDRREEFNEVAKAAAEFNLKQDKFDWEQAKFDREQARLDAKDEREWQQKIQMQEVPGYITVPNTWTSDKRLDALKEKTGATEKALTTLDNLRKADLSAYTGQAAQWAKANTYLLLQDLREYTESGANFTEVEKQILEALSASASAKDASEYIFDLLRGRDPEKLVPVLQGLLQKQMDVLWAMEGKLPKVTPNGQSYEDYFGERFAARYGDLFERVRQKSPSFSNAAIGQGPQSSKAQLMQEIQALQQATQKLRGR